MIWALLAAILNLSAGILHLAIIWGGPDWYRFFGAGEKYARWAEEGKLRPALTCVAIAMVLFVWAFYCLALLNLVVTPPFLIPILWLVTMVYFIRGVFPLLGAMVLTTLRAPFVIYSSLICTGFALVHWLAILSFCGAKLC